MPEHTPLTRRRWFRFGLRSLLVFTALVGLLMGWIVKERRQSAREMEIAEELRAQIGFAVPFASEAALETSWWAQFCNSVLGPRVDRICTTSWEDLSPVSELTYLNFLRIDDAKFTGLEPVSGLWRLEELYLYRAPVEDLTPLAGCRRLRILHLHETKMDDITPLSNLDSLEDLNLSDTRVHDLTPLAGLKKLRNLEIFGILASSQQIDALKKALPDCDILHDE